MTIPALLAFEVLIECLRNRDWLTARALVPAAVDEEAAVDKETAMCRRPCRIPAHHDDPRAAEPVGWRTALEWCDLAPVVEWCEQPEEDRAAAQRRVASLNRLPAVVLQTLPALRQQLMYAPHRPPKLVERLIEAVAAWKADPRRSHEADSNLCAAYQALEDADIFRGGSQPEPPPIPREEPEDDIPPSSNPEPVPRWLSLPSEQRERCIAWLEANAGGFMAGLVAAEVLRGLNRTAKQIPPPDATPAEPPVSFPGRTAEQLHVLATALRQQHAADGHKPRDPRWPAAAELDKLARYRAKSEQGSQVVLTEANLAPDIDRLNAAGWKLRDNGYWSLPGSSTGTHSTQAALQALQGRHNREVLDSIHRVSEAQREAAKGMMTDAQADAMLRGPRRSDR